MEMMFDVGRWQHLLFSIENHRERFRKSGAAVFPRGAAAAANILLRFGDEKLLMNRGEAGNLTGRLLQRETAKKTRRQIKDEFDNFRARINIFGGATSAGAYFE